MASARRPATASSIDGRTPSKFLRSGVPTVVVDDTGSLQATKIFSDDGGFYLYYEDGGELIEVHRIVDVRVGITPPGKDARSSATLKGMNALVPVEERTVCISMTNARQRLSVVDLVDLYLVLYSNEEARALQKDVLHLVCDPLHASPSVLHLLRKNHSYLMLSNANGDEISVKDLASVFLEGQDDKVMFTLESLKLKPKKSGSGVKKSDLPFEQFYAVYSHLCPRVEMVDFVRNVAEGKVRNMMLPGSDFHRLLTDEKYNYDPRRNSLLFPKPTRAETDVLMVKHSVGKAKANKLSVDSLNHFLLSDDNLVVESNWYQLCDDMNQPLSHYFINSSHNTYLTGHQLTSKSSAQMYRVALLSGCRCVELDCWPGENEAGEPEPYITHGMTMCTKVLYKDCIEAIAETAFVASDFPVILSFENHCTTNVLQEKMARYCREIFGDMLLADPLPGYSLEKGVHLPPPSMLKRKILIKNKKRMSVKGKREMFARPSVTSVTVESLDGETRKPEEDELDEEEDEEEDGGDPSANSGGPLEATAADIGEVTGAAVKDVDVVNMELAAIVNYVQPVPFKSLDASMKQDFLYHMSSFSEDRGLRLVQESPAKFVQYTARQMSRVYPRRSRVYSGNFQPQTFWNCGSQLVAMNYQVADSPMQLNIGRFALNGNCGYLRKPKCFTSPTSEFDPFASRHNGLLPCDFCLEIISGQFLCKRPCSVSIEVDIIGVPPDVRMRKLRTRPCKDMNTINPRWKGEVFREKITVPEMATIKIAAVDERGTLLGVRFLPAHLLQPGYRHIPLLNRLGKPSGMASLFVRIQVSNFMSEADAGWVEAFLNPTEFMESKKKVELRELALRDLTLDEECAEEDVGGAAAATSTRPPTLTIVSI